jgi:hypothetical protein
LTEARYFYCKRWFSARRTMIEPMTAEEAESAHHAAGSYTVVAGSPDQPAASLVFTADFIGVAFHDRELRAYLSYDFRLQPDGRLFMTSATHREFAGPSDQAVEASHYIFSRSGEVKIRRQTYGSSAKLETSKSTIDVSGNYDVWPLFGRYESLLRIERG